MASSPTQFALSQPPKTPRSLASAASVRLNIGDKVTLPEGQTGILRYVGTIEGKSGEFAGVELIGDHVSMGRHNGDHDGYVILINIVYIFIYFIIHQTPHPPPFKNY